MIDICVIGYGYWGPNLCRNFSNLTGYNLTAICDINKQNLSIAKKNYPNVKTYKNFKEAINENNFQLQKHDPKKITSIILFDFFSYSLSRLDWVAYGKKRSRR